MKIKVYVSVICLHSYRLVDFPKTGCSDACVMKLDVITCTLHVFEGFYTGDDILRNGSADLN